MSLDNNLCDKSDPLMDVSIYPNNTNTKFVGELLAKDVNSFLVIKRLIYQKKYHGLDHG